MKTEILHIGNKKKSQNFSKDGIVIGGFVQSTKNRGKEVEILCLWQLFRLKRQDFTWQFLVSIFFGVGGVDKQSPNRLGKAMGMTVPHFRKKLRRNQSESLGKSTLGDSRIIFSFSHPPSKWLADPSGFLSEQMILPSRKKFLWLILRKKNEGKDCLFSFLSSAPYLDSAANPWHSKQNYQKKYHN